MQQTTENDASKLAAALSSTFPIDDTKIGFSLFPLSNEDYFAKALKRLNHYPVTVSEKMGVALLFGESHFLSMLPELSLHARMIIQADIEPQLHRHTQHLLACLQQSDNPETFLVNYQRNNPIVGLSRQEDGEPILWDLATLTKAIQGEIGCVRYSLKNYHFLSGLERYQQCKKAASQLIVVQICCNLLEETDCQQLADILKEANAQLKLANFTNIRTYDEQGQLNQTIPILLKNAPDCFIMYSNNKNRGTNLSQKVSDYLSGVTIFKSKHVVKDHDIDIDAKQLC